MEGTVKRTIKLGGREIGLTKVIIVSCVLVAAIITIVVLLMQDSKMKATTMRLLRMEGNITLEENGVAKTVKENLRFKSGDALSTDVASLVAVGLDDTKTITLDEESRAEFTKSGKQLRLDLTKGRLFFNVTEKLEADATFEIHTSNTTVGIRGTSGVVCYDEEGKPAVYLTDGEIKAEAYNPVTGETKEVKIKAPAKIEVHYYNDRPQGKTVEFSAVPLEPDMLPDFALDEIYNDEALMERIAEYTGWTITDIKDAHDNKGNPTPTPTPTPSPTPSPTPTPTPTPTPEPTVEPTPNPTPTPTPEPTVEPTPTPTPEPTSEPEPEPTSAPTQAPTATPTPTVTPTATPSGTPDPEPSGTPTQTPTQTPTLNPTPTVTPNATLQGTTITQNGASVGTYENGVYKPGNTDSAQMPIIIDDQTQINLSNLDQTQFNNTGDDAEVYYFTVGDQSTSFSKTYNTSDHMIEYKATDSNGNTVSTHNARVTTGGINFFDSDSAANAGTPVKAFLSDDGTLTKYY